MIYEVFTVDNNMKFIHWFIINKLLFVVLKGLECSQESPLSSSSLFGKLRSCKQKFGQSTSKKSGSWSGKSLHFHYSVTLERKQSLSFIPFLIIDTLSPYALSPNLLPNYVVCSYQFKFYGYFTCNQTMEVVDVSVCILVLLLILVCLV